MSSSRRRSMLAANAASSDAERTSQRCRSSTPITSSRRWLSVEQQLDECFGRVVTVGEASALKRLNRVRTRARFVSRAAHSAPLRRAPLAPAAPSASLHGASERLEQLVGQRLHDGKGFTRRSRRRGAQHDGAVSLGLEPARIEHPRPTEAGLGTHQAPRAATVMRAVDGEAPARLLASSRPTSNGVDRYARETSPIPRARAPRLPIGAPSLRTRTAAASRGRG